MAESMTPDERQEYIAAVVQALVGRDPKDYAMSSAEFHVLTTWMACGYPLRIVLRAIGDMDKHPSVMYVKDAVERAVAEWEAKQPKPSGLVGESEIGAAVEWVSERGGTGPCAVSVLTLALGNSSSKAIKAALEKAEAPPGVYGLLNAAIYAEAKK